MNESPQVVRVRWPVAVVAAFALIAAGAGLALLLNRERQPRPAAALPGPRPSVPSAEAIAGRAEPVAIAIPQDAAARAGVQLVTVSTTLQAGELTVPAVVEPHGYKQVRVTPLAAGRLTRVNAELGQQVQRGQPLAEIYSPELARAQTVYLSASAQLEAARQRLKRTDRLIEIGAASRQEQEEARAEEARLATEVESARSQLVLLGMAAARVQRLTMAGQMTATVTVPAPIAGVITTREANIGQNVDQGTTLFTVVDLSTVWVVGNIYERDFGRVRVGTPATMTTDAYAGLTMTGRVSYIDPSVDPATRTARLRVEVTNRDRLLRLGMYVALALATATSRSVVTVPADAVQTLGSNSVVYVVDPGQPSRFIERRVEVGARAGDDVEIVVGLQAGEVIAGKGSFFIRAERERIAPSVAAPAAPSGAVPLARGAPETVVEVNERGFEPSHLTVARGELATITFIRRTDDTCAKEVEVPSQRIRRELPLNQAVTVQVKAAASAEIAFACGMNMLKGVIVVE